MLIACPADNAMFVPTMLTTVSIANTAVSIDHFFYVLNLLFVFCYFSFSFYNLSPFLDLLNSIRHSLVYISARCADLLNHFH